MEGGTERGTQMMKNPDGKESKLYYSDKEKSLKRPEDETGILQNAFYKY